MFTKYVKKNNASNVVQGVPKNGTPVLFLR